MNVAITVEFFSKRLDAGLRLISEADVVVERVLAEGTLTLRVVGVEEQHPEPLFPCLSKAVNYQSTPKGPLPLSF